MKYYISFLKAFTFSCFLTMPYSNIRAQYVSPYNSNGIIKPIEQRRYDEYKSKQNTYTPKPVKTEPVYRPVKKDPVYTPVKTEPTKKYPSANTQQTNTPPPRVTEVKGYKYDEIRIFYDGLACVKLNGKYGFIDETGKPFIPLIYDFATEFQQGISCVWQGDKSGFIDKNGTVVIPLIYDPSSFYVSEGCMPISINNKWGMLDTKGNIIIPFIYEQVGFFKNGFATVKLNNKWGFIDRKGFKVVPHVYNDKDRYNISAELIDGKVRVNLNGEISYFDKGKRVTVKPPISKSVTTTINKTPPVKYDWIDAFFEGIAVVEFKDKYGFINESGKLITPICYDYTSKFKDGLGLVKMGYNYGFVNNTGAVVIPLIYNKTSMAFNEGLVSMALDSKWGFLDKNGKTVVPFIYQYVMPFSEGLAAVKLNQKWAYINKKGKIIIPYKYDDAMAFEGGVAPVSEGSSWGYINTKGEEMVPFIYSLDDMIRGRVKTELIDEIIHVTFNGQTSYFDNTGKDVTPGKSPINKTVQSPKVN